MEISLEQLQQVFNQSFENCPVITLETQKMDIPTWDSMTHLNLVLNLEEAFNYGFSIDEIENMKSVQQIMSVLSKG